MQEICNFHHFPVYYYARRKLVHCKIVNIWHRLEWYFKPSSTLSPCVWWICPNWGSGGLADDASHYHVTGRCTIYLKRWKGKTPFVAATMRFLFITSSRVTMDEVRVGGTSSAPDADVDVQVSHVVKCNELCLSIT